MIGRMNRIVWTGIVIVALSLCTLGSWTHWSNTRTWTLVDGVPISLAKGSHYSWPELRVNFDTRYFIDLYVDNNMDSKQLGCMLGQWNARVIACDPSAALRVRWVVSGAGAPQQSTSDETLDRTAAADTTGFRELERDLGVFKGRKNQRYRLDLYVLSDSAALNPTNHRLYVHVQGAELVNNLVWSALIRVACYSLAILGVLISVWGVYDGQRIRAMQHVQSHTLDRTESEEPGE